DHRLFKGSIVIRGKSIARASKWEVDILFSAADKPLNGPHDGGSSAMTSISDGHHAGRVRAEIHSASGRNSRSRRTCLVQSGSPAILKLALSMPMRRERPPTKSTAVSVLH